VNNFFKDNKLIYKVCTYREFNDTLDLFYDTALAVSPVAGDAMVKLLNSFGDCDEGVPINQEDVNKLVNMLIVDAYEMGASDIHIEPEPGKTRTGIRLRKDGVMFNFFELPWTCRDALINRFKYMCDMDI
jgi:type II secretory ATPase GspE/PulE/Tfp pilus assembly ATPase PilB-like protein